MSTNGILTMLAVVLALLTVLAERAGLRRCVYVFKPLTMVSIIVLALLKAPSASPAYRQLIIGGLLFSLAGDIFLMLPRDRFVQGLVSFLVAHVFYIAAFTVEGARTPNAWAVVPLVLYGALMLGLLWPRLGRLKAPVVVYVSVILLMAWQAANRWLAVGQTSDALALAGALLFVVSDSALAWNRFRGRFRGAQAVVLGTYFAAQWLIALST